MLEWFKKRGKWVVSGIVFITGFFLVIFNRKLRAKVTVLENEKENAVLEERNNNIAADVKDAESELKEHRDNKPEVKDEKDINDLSDYFNRKR